MSEPHEISRALRTILQLAGECDRVLARRLRVGVSDLHAIDQVLSSTGPVGPAELGRRLAISSASVTAMVDRLEHAGHLRRQPAPGDRRRITLSATESARAGLWAELRPLIDRTDGVAAQRSPEQIEVILDFLTDIAGAMREFTESTPDRT